MTVEGYETIETINGTPGCADCQALLCVQNTGRHGVEGTSPITGTVGRLMLPRPSPGTITIQCAGCGTVLWDREDE